jgi:hypothetical protein
MPLIFVQRWAPSGPVAVTGGTQTVSGTLDISNGVTVEYDSGLFNYSNYPSATYTLFNFGALNPASPVDVNTYFTSVLTGTGYNSAVYAIVGNTITVSLSLV